MKDRLLDRHLCLNLYPCVTKVQSVSQSVTKVVDGVKLITLPPPLPVHGQSEPPRSTVRYSESVPMYRVLCSVHKTFVVTRRPCPIIREDKDCAVAYMIRQSQFWTRRPANGPHAMFGYSWSCAYCFFSNAREDQTLYFAVCTLDQCEPVRYTRSLCSVCLSGSFNLIFNFFFVSPNPLQTESDMCRGIWISFT